jgi:predicted  nucleic acid-binding Zn-ribbon protein
MTHWYTAAAMIRSMILLSLLLAIPTTSDNTKPPTKQEIIQLRTTVKELEDIVAEQQDRLQAHKVEGDSLKKRLSTLEARVSDLENAVHSVTPRQ